MDSQSPSADRLRLPKLVEADPRAAAVSAALEQHTELLWSGGDLRTPVVELTDSLAHALKSARAAGRITRGLERTEQKLASELRGLDQVDRKSETVRGQRASRLILVANDCAERMYRRVETLLRRNRGRLVVVQLESGDQEIGSLLFGAGSSAKLLMLGHKDAVAEALFALADSDSGANSDQDSDSN